MIKAAAMVGAAATLSVISSPALPDQYAERVDRLDAFIEEGPMGSSRDHWLSMINVFGDKERVGIIFGLANDLAFCHDILDLYRKKYPNNRLFCEPAN